MAISCHVERFVERSILNPVSFEDVSLQERLILDRDAVEAFKLVGALGIPFVSIVIAMFMELDCVDDVSLSVAVAKRVWFPTVIPLKVME
mgnify:CR=1 FL=1